MFETTFPETALSGARPGPSQGGELRVFDWAELCARISAASELRRVVASARHTGGFANFAADGAAQDRAQSNCERTINLEPSNNRKPYSAKPSGTSPPDRNTHASDRNNR